MGKESQGLHWEGKPGEKKKRGGAEIIVRGWVAAADKEEFEKKEFEDGREFDF